MDTHGESGSIVVGVDGSGTALNAARWAAYLAEALDAPLVIAAAGPHRHGSPNGAEQARGAAEYALRLVRRCDPDLPITTEVSAETAHRVLVDRSRGARMLVVGAQTAWDDHVVGSTTMAVARHAHCPVAIWRGVAGRPIPRNKPVALGVDGTALSAAAVALGFDLAAAFHVPLTAVHYWPPERIAPLGAAPDRAPAERAVLTQALAAPRLTHPEVPVTELALPAVPGPALTELSHNAQLLVLGTRARSTTAAALFGSTSRDLLHHSACPVLLCR
ncbi:Universal stress protein MSMEG_3950 [Nocardia otitidiscaviarum]|uniref:Universal stress protein MSMEG_3950 n=1 Tax=Nocardia otitidiscaviarum TaxID=1823 RepID=A0A378YVR5_9NOCA|nr:universal stress protein [Nocardia otitidiscaviarum]SUA80529.1 Universal stress protein MSMEG_3950 [Nocardia otitidiscaviarum]